MQPIRSRTCALLVVACSFISLTPVGALAANTDEAIQALIAFKEGCNRAEALWPAQLCGPIVLVDPSTREAVANQPAPGGQFKRQEGMFLGKWPTEMDVANTAMAWGGTQWAVVMLPLSQDPFTRLQLLAHESFHRIQPELGFDMADTMAQHLDEQEARTWLRLELRALARSLRSEGDDAREAALDALLFRHIRNASFPDSEPVERRLEGHEGLAEYTGMRFALDATGAGMEEIARRVEAFEKRTTYVRSLGYGTGPALGMLLDRYQPGWRRSIGTTPDLARHLASALAAPEASSARRDVADRRAAIYGYATIREEETKRSEHLTAERKRYRQALIEGPVLHVELPERRLLYNPNTVLSLGDEGNVYPKSTLIGPWGRLTLQDGGALAPGYRDRARVAAPKIIAPDAQGIVTGPGWTLTLELGWRLVPATRSGDFRIERVEGTE
ncbi:hypothetical protein [Steroidobacter cummioxidans]|uniref:hypothetical protein n=1 Tax=Steroidobacter cummioxidans TaxID=1803913 RepID=UPI00128FD2FC|nr:hypothetical protein [Steroidobacter cummioxidans]